MIAVNKGHKEIVAIIAGTEFTHNLILVTSNISEFSRLSNVITLVNWSKLFLSSEKLI